MDEDGHLGVRFEVYSPTLLPAPSLLFLSTHRGQTLIAAAEASSAAMLSAPTRLAVSL